MSEDPIKDLCQIGQGAYGRVFRATYKNHRTVAVKDMQLTPDTGFLPSHIRQISTLKKLRGHPSIVQLLDVLYVPKQPFVRLVFQYCESDLRKHLSKTSLSFQQLKAILRQILTALSFCHARKIMHRDLKPENILIDEKGVAKVADFGLARLLSNPDKALTPEVETLWYRAPEVLLGQAKYGLQADMWSVGCIMAEMYLRKPLFFGNRYEVEQIFTMFQYLGTPDVSQWQGLEHFKCTFPKWKKTDNIQKDFAGLGLEGVDLLKQLLTYNPSTRITADAAMSHPFFKQTNPT